MCKPLPGFICRALTCCLCNRAPAYPTRAAQPPSHPTNPILNPRTTIPSQSPHPTTPTQSPTSPPVPRHPPQSPTSWARGSTCSASSKTPASHHKCHLSLRKARPQAPSLTTRRRIRGTAFRHKGLGVPGGRHPPVGTPRGVWGDWGDPRGVQETSGGSCWACWGSCSGEMLSQLAGNAAVRVWQLSGNRSARCSMDECTPCIDPDRALAREIVTLWS